MISQEQLAREEVLSEMKERIRNGFKQKEKVGSKVD